MNFWHILRQALYFLTFYALVEVLVCASDAYVMFTCVLFLCVIHDMVMLSGGLALNIKH